MGHLLNFSKRLVGRLSEYLAEKSAQSSNVHQSKNEVTLVQFKRQEETKDFFFGESVCLGVDAEVPRRPDERHLVSIENLRILFMAVIAWYHRCHLLLARIPFIQVV